MRILVLSNYYPPIELGGWEQLTCNVVNRLQNNGHFVEVLTSNYHKEKIHHVEPGIHRILHLESYDPEHYHPTYTITRRQNELENIDVLTRSVRSFNPDIIFVNGMWNLPYSVAKTAEDLLPNRVVYYLASYWPTEPDAHTAYWNAPADNLFIQASKAILGSLLKKTLLLSTPRNQLKFHRVLCVSEFIQEYVIDEVGLPKDQTYVVHNGIELELFKVNSVPRIDNELHLLYAGRLAPDKGVHTILESLGIVKLSRPDILFQLSIYGSGTPEYIERLKSLVAKFNLENIVHFNGVVPREQMPDIFTRNHVLIFPSVWDEPLARVIQEAMASGLAVIGTATGGTKEILRDEGNGLVFDSNNSKMLAEKIVKVFDDENLRARLALAGRKTVENEFSLEKMVNEIEENFAKVLESDG